MANIQQEVDILVKKIYQITNAGKRKSQSAFRKAAPVLIKAIKERAPVSKEPHYRYSNGIAIEYKPGNLRRSFKTLTFKRSAAVFVGPKVDRGGKGPYTGNRTDGFYAPFVEYGTVAQPPQPFVRPAVSAAGDQTLKVAVQQLKAVIEGEARRLSV